MILTLIDWILFIPLALCVSYLLVYAIASKFYRSPNYPKADRLHRIAVFFPAYREDKVIIDSVRSFLEQDYPKEMYDVYVISDHMQDPTDEGSATVAHPSAGSHLRRQFKSQSTPTGHPRHRGRRKSKRTAPPPTGFHV